MGGRRIGRRIATALLAAPLAWGGCGVRVEPLMPTPLVYTATPLEPLAHVPPAERWTPRRVYYATVRERRRNLQEIAYGNAPSAVVSVGLALIGFGGPGTSWDDLEQSSRAARRDEVLPLTIDGIVEAGRFERDARPEDAAAPSAAGWMLEDLGDAIADARDTDVLVYVHGAKVNFYNACAFAAQLDHFMGRDMTAVAFSWPTRQNLLAYALGSDRTRAYESAPALASLLELLATATDARRIHVLSWSAGGRVATRALASLRERHPDEPLEALRERLRLGTAYFAAGDVPTGEFLEALPVIHELVDRVVVTASSEDDALKSAIRFMGGHGRIGQKGSRLTPEEVAMVEGLARFEGIDVSHRAASRGFDITGHRYWFDHPWASSDVILAIRTDLGPAERGLAQRDSPVVWYVPDDYPERLARAVEGAKLERW